MARLHLRVAAPVARRLVVLLLVSALAMGLIAVKYLNVLGSMGIGVHHINLELPQARGLHPAAAVTWQGVQVGSVVEVKVAPDASVTAQLRLDNDYDIPADVQAHVREGSPIGEAYVDLVSTADSSGPPLRTGDRIGGEEVTLALATTDMVDAVNTLLESVPRGALASVLAELDQASQRLGADLATIIDATSRLEETATENLDPTISLIHALEPVLHTQAQTAPAIRDAVAKLATFTGGLRSDDKRFRHLLKVSKPLTRQGDKLVADLNQRLPTLLADVATVARVLRVYIPGLEHILILLPALESAFGNLLHEASDTDPFDYLKLDFKTPLNNPPACIEGYSEAKKQRSPNDMSPAPVPTDSWCKVPESDPRAVRGIRNNPCPNSTKRGATSTECGLEFPRYTPQGPGGK